MSRLIDHPLFPKTLGYLAHIRSCVCWLGDYPECLQTKSSFELEKEALDYLAVLQADLPGLGELVKVLNKELNKSLDENKTIKKES